MSKKIDLDPYRAQVAAAKDEASKAFAAFAKGREDFHAGGHDLTDDTSDAFKALDDLNRTYGDAAEKAKRAEERYVSLLEMETPQEVKAEFGERTAEKIQKAAENAADALLKSPEYEHLVKSRVLDNPQGRVQVDPVKVIDRDLFVKTLVTGLSNTQAGAFVVANRDGEFVTIERRPRRMLDLVTTGTTDSDTVEFVRMTGRTNAAAETPEATATGDAAAVAPESGFALEVVQTLVKDISHYIPATRRALQDAGQMRTLIDAELFEGAMERLDAQIAVGSGTGENLLGFMNTPGILSQSIATDSMADAIHKAMTKIRLQYFEPEAIAINPLDWEAVRLEKDSAGNYKYGPANASDNMSIWGVNTVQTAIMTAGTPAVGAFKKAAVYWSRSGVDITMTDSHSDWFLKKLVAVMASTRGAFGVKRPGAICELTV